MDLVIPFSVTSWGRITYKYQQQKPKQTQLMYCLLSAVDGSVCRRLSWLRSWHDPIGRHNPLVEVRGEVLLLWCPCRGEKSERKNFHWISSAGTDLNTPFRASHHTRTDTTLVNSCQSFLLILAISDILWRRDGWRWSSIEGKSDSIPSVEFLSNFTLILVTVWLRLLWEYALWTKRNDSERRSNVFIH